MAKFNPFKKKLRQFAKALNADRPWSEIWFLKEYKASGHRDATDRCNTPFKGKFIPDILNLRYKFVVEVDGSVHQTPEQIMKDREKDVFYRMHGMTVIRVIAYDKISLSNALNKIIALKIKNF
jgi:very-short-patch-repair endonuclease